MTRSSGVPTSPARADAAQVGAQGGARRGARQDDRVLPDEGQIGRVRRVVVGGGGSGWWGQPGLLIAIASQTRDADRLATRADDPLSKYINSPKKQVSTGRTIRASSQIRRAAHSVAGQHRGGICQTFRQRTRTFPEHRGSPPSLQWGYCLHVARRLAYIDDAPYSRLDIQVRQTTCAARRSHLHGVATSLGSFLSYPSFSSLTRLN